MQIKQQALACSWYQPLKMRAAPEGRDPFAAGSWEYPWSPGGNKDPRLPRQILNWARLFMKMRIKQRVWHHLPFSPTQKSAAAEL